MKKALIFFAIAGFVWACGNSSTASTDSSTTSPNAETVAAVDKPDGEKIYKTYCVTCHGLYGDMGASGAANLTESKLSVDERITVITNGRGAMTAFESLLDKKEIKAVAKFTMTLAEE
jgi:mono/diheme cytochrome c family protein